MRQYGRRNPRDDGGLKVLERNELDILRSRGHNFKDPFEIVDVFESKIAEFVGAPFGVAVDSCTHAIELCLRYLKARGQIQVPRRTYPSVPMTLMKLGCQIAWQDVSWQGRYRLDPYPIVDASMDLRPHSYEAGVFLCLSFQQKKSLPIGRGGMVLTDNSEAAEWIRRASYDGRVRGKEWKTHPPTQLGYHYYMTPEDAARGLLLFEETNISHYKFGGYQDYPDISKLDVFRADVDNL